MLIRDLGDKTLHSVDHGHLYFKPGFARVALGAARDANGLIPLEAVEQVWPQANPYAATWFIGERAYWTNLTSLFEWPLSGGPVKATQLPDAGGWYNVAVNQRYVFVSTLGCKRLRRIDRTTGEATEAVGLVMPRVEGAPSLYASETRLYCASHDDGRLWSVSVDFQDLRMHVELEPRSVVKLSLVDAGYLYFAEDLAAGARVGRMDLKSEQIERLFDGTGWAMSPIRRVDDLHIAWLSPQSLRVVKLADRSLREFDREPYFAFGKLSTPGVDLLFDAENVYWFRVDAGGHLMVTPRSYFGI
jgi:hypothetical protein